MRAYGECHWYHDEEYQHGNACEIVPDEPTADQMVAADDRRRRGRIRHGTGDRSPRCPALSWARTDCWYDGETDAYYHYEFSAARPRSDTASRSDESMTPDGRGFRNCLRRLSQRRHSTPTGRADAEWPHETAGQDASVEDMAGSETVESNEDGAGKTTRIPSTRSEEYADSADEMEASSSVEDQADAEFTEDSEEVMESTTDVAETTTPSAETPATWPSREYDYKYGGYPYDYESYEPAYVEPTYSEPGYSEPVQAWEDADVEVVEGEDDEESVPPAPTSDLVEFDSEVILSLARTLDRVGSTLQSLSQYLTEMATAETADHHGETLHR